MITTRQVVAVASAAALAMIFAQGAASADEAKCQDGVAKNSRNVGNQEQKKNRKCIKNGAGDVDGCIDAESAKALIKRSKLQALYAPGGKCVDPPAPFVNADPDDIANDTEQAAGDIIRRVFGDPVDGIVAGSKCHDKIAKRAGKKFDTELKAFRACVKANGPLTTQGAVDACVNLGVNDTKAQLTVQPKLEADMAGQCTFSSPPPPLEDGDCSGCTAAPDCAACVGDIVDCEACLAMNNSNGGTANCDLEDDGLVNSSCVVAPSCPIAAGRYTVTQIPGGTLKVDGAAPFGFPVGGFMIQEVSSASLPDCVHDVVVPFPGGFSAPVFCSVAAFNFTTSVEQAGCGRGYIDSNGGSDFTVTERGDTSAPGAPCGLSASCVTGANSNVRVDLTLGGNGADVCVGAGNTANAFVGVPVHIVTWQDLDGDCPDVDGQYDPGTDTLISDVLQNLDFTTDASNADWTDLDPDGCCIAGSGPGATSPCNTAPAGLSATGVCLNPGSGTVTTGGTGTIGSSGAPLFDLTFSTTSPNIITGPVANTGAICPGFVIPPATGGTITRCIP